MAASRNASASASTIALLTLVMILFGIVVGYGWTRLLAVDMDAVAAGTIAALITVIAVLLAQQVARAMLARRESGGGLGKLFFLYSILFVISALGTINAAFYNFEGASVLQQVIDDAEPRLAALDGAARNALRDGAQNERTAAVERLLVQLDGEIRSPTGNCGVGPEARAIIAQIRGYLPEFREFSRRPGAQPACNDAALTALSNRYRDTALAMLGIDAAERARVQLRNEIAAPLAEARRQLAAAERRLATGGGFGSGYEAARLALENAATAYSEGREKLASADRAAADALDPAIDVSRARYLGSITAMPGTLAERLDYWTTWAYFIIAVLLDLFLVFMFVESLRAAPAPIPVTAPETGDPRFLWVNQGA